MPRTSPRMPARLANARTWTARAARLRPAPIPAGATRGLATQNLSRTLTSPRRRLLSFRAMRFANMAPSPIRGTRMPAENPGEFLPMTSRNKRYVYFQESQGGPYGCLNEPVTERLTNPNGLIPVFFGWS